MRIGYSKGWTVLLLVMGAALVVMNLLLVRGGADVIRFFPAVVCLIVGAAYATRPWFELTEDAVVVKAAIGPLKKVHAFGDLSEVRIEGGKLWVGAKKTGVTRWLANKDDWARLEARLATAKASEVFE